MPRSQKPAATFAAVLRPGPCRGPDFSVRCEAGSASFSFQMPSVKDLSTCTMVVYLSAKTQSKLQTVQFEMKSLEVAVKTQFKSVFRSYRNVVIIRTLKDIPDEVEHLRQDLLERFGVFEDNERSCVIVPPRLAFA